ncbi:hypothetical protein BGZ97_013228 [Linnemannia gamsii]|uniref:Uncharacterized protein n=1 Tax=Linnemannia gamsii TaxID=64522 RepID=A0A9P6R0S7_9FUNG|nr:hypothetical protein BGZ97_013228 [Linnemannia gamsii]
MSVSARFLSLARHCPLMARLSVSYECGRMQTPELATFLPSPSFRKIRRLEFSVTKIEDFGCLNSGYQETMVMLDLEHLHTIFSQLGREDEKRLQLAILQFLMTRTRLRSFGMALTVPIDPKVVFAQARMEYEHGWEG